MKNKLTKQQMVERHLLYAVKAKFGSDNLHTSEYWRGQQVMAETTLAILLEMESDPTNTVYSRD